MRELSSHGEWLSLIDVSGPFLAEPVLNQAFPQGLEQIDPLKRKLVRQAYEKWQEAIDCAGPQLLESSTAWIDLVLKNILELDEDEKGTVLKPQAKLSNKLKYTASEHSVTIRPYYAVVDEQDDDRSLLLVQIYPLTTPLDEPIKGEGWAATSAERMVALCRANGVRLGLVTNGERWMLVDAPAGAVSTFASWYARLWGQEPKTLQAFVNLLGIRRFFVDSSEQLPALLDESLKHQSEVTDALGEQVRRAIEVLIQRLDRADVDLNRKLLHGVEPSELYEAVLTVMMRIVFLLSAEERGLLLMGDERYEVNYAVSTLRMQLRAETEEILERRQDAWSRLLSVFRAVYGGIQHEILRLPALGGSLFDPDRFPFLEGRAKESNWKTDFAKPVPIDNMTVLLLLDAVQLFQGRALSYRALDVEQIGYVYEGLLEQTVVRAEEVTLGLSATKSAKMPWVTLDELETAAEKGQVATQALLEERTGSSASRVRNDLDKKVDKVAADKLLTACHSDQDLRNRIKPYFHFLRMDRWGYPLVYPEKTFMVTTGVDRRETGTHYTPKSLTEAIVKETLEPIVYTGLKEGKPRDEWVLKTPDELLSLKICDPAMGSGAFLVQTCRWLSERLVEAWEQSESAGNAVTSEGIVVEKNNGFEPMRNDIVERLLTAKRLISERCLYGVDINPLAVELAKLSIWLVTLAKGRPFGFLDHNLRCGDSLLGIRDLEQLYYFDMKPGKGSSKKLFAQKIEEAVEEAIKRRVELRNRPIRDIRDVEIMANLDEEVRHLLELPELIADAFVGEILSVRGGDIDTTVLAIESDRVLEGDRSKTRALRERANKGLSTDLLIGRPARRPIHWPLEFPEVFSREGSGFDAIIGNPPFLGGQKITGIMGTAYRELLVKLIGFGTRGSADLVSYFFLRAFSILRDSGTFGLLAVNTIAEGDTREVGLDQILAQHGKIFAAYPSEEWPGSANVVTSRVHITKDGWSGARTLSGKLVNHISSFLGSREQWTPVKLKSNLKLAFQGSTILGQGFLVDEAFAAGLIATNPENEQVLYPYLIGKEINQSPEHLPGRWVINFFDWSKDRCERDYPELFNLVREKVKPEREKLKDQALKDKWWMHYAVRFALYHKIGLGKLYDNHPRGWKDQNDYPSQVIACATGATKYPCFTLIPNRYIYANTVCVIASQNYALFACLSSDLHTIWAWEHGSKMGYGLRYTHGDIFETFPFPDCVLEGSHSMLAALGQKFFERRRDYMLTQNKGMTDFYNDFHDRNVQNEAIDSLRNLQIDINDAVLTTYGFTDIDPEYDFHEVGYLPEGKNEQFTVSEASREELLYRLAMVNKSRAVQEKKKKAMIRGIIRQVARSKRQEAATQSGLFQARDTSPTALDSRAKAGKPDSE